MKAKKKMQRVELDVTLRGYLNVELPAADAKQLIRDIEDNQGGFNVDMVPGVYDWDQFVRDAEGEVEDFRVKGFRVKK